MNIQIEQLSLIKKLILEQYISKYADKPFGFSAAHCIDVDRSVYDDVEIETALNSLVDSEYFTKNEDGSFIMPLEVHRYVKEHFNNSLQSETFNNADEKHWYEKPSGIIFLIVIGGLVVAFLSYFFGWS